MHGKASWQVEQASTLLKNHTGRPETLPRAG
jgi:hypothetical protein